MHVFSALSTGQRFVLTFEEASRLRRMAWICGGNAALTAAVGIEVRRCREGGSENRMRYYFKAYIRKLG